MQVFEGVTNNCFILEPNEQTPDEWNHKSGTKYFMQNGMLYKFVKNLFLSYITDIEDTVAKKIIQEQQWFKNAKYHTDTVYLNDDLDEKFPLQSDILLYAMAYFRAIYNKFGTESATILMLNPHTKEWRLLIPVQGKASLASVSYACPNELDLTKPFEKAIHSDAEMRQLHEAVIQEYTDLYDQGYRMFGTIHSHSNFGAFHSGVDDADEIKFDGLHITIGHVNTHFSFSARYMIASVEFKHEINDLLADTTVEELIKLVDDVVVEPDHIARMKPTLGQYQFMQSASKATKIAPGQFHVDQYWLRDSWEEKNKAYSGLDSLTEDEWKALKDDWAPSYKVVNPDESLSLKEHDLNVHNTDNAVWFFDKSDNMPMSVSWKYWKDNKTLFTNCVEISDDAVRALFRSFVKQNEDR